MFEAVELGQTLSKSEFKQHEAVFRTELLQLQRRLAESRLSTLIIVGGIDGAGKGDVVNLLNKWFDNRGMETHAFWDETDEERQRPQYWRYWRCLPGRGNIAVMFGGWYRPVIEGSARQAMTVEQLDVQLGRIQMLEQMLEQDGMLLVKLWLHLSPEAYQKRLKQSAVPESAGQSKKAARQWYQNHQTAAETVLRQTDTCNNPWHLIEADDSHFRNDMVGRILQRVMQHALQTKTQPERRQAEALVDETGKTVLDTLDFPTLSRESYKKQLKHYAARLKTLSWQMYRAGKSTVIVFEGWDAAGKGGAIRRLTNPMDARLYRVISVAAPTDEERAHHYLWRFWRNIPRHGYCTIYDRSWYGRVLVERVEKFASSLEWQRAYQEINQFESQLVDDSVVLLKFWLHISPQEQLARFEERQKTPWKQHKITEEDWRNREKWEDYTLAVNEMVRRTSTLQAPWTLVEANDKLYARIKVLKTVCDTLQQALEAQDED